MNKKCKNCVYDYQKSFFPGCSRNLHRDIEDLNERGNRYIVNRQANKRGKCEHYICKYFLKFWAK